MHRFVKTTLFVALVAVGLAGCQELTVPNLNNPERERVLSEPQDVEALIAGTWTQVWALWQGGNYPALQLSAIADEFTTTHENWGGWTLSSEPRTRFDNHPEYTYSALAENPYYNTYDALASVHDGLEAILERGIEIEYSGADHTPRTLAFGKFTQGVLLGYLGLLFDRAIIVTENTPIADGDLVREMEFAPYTEVRDSAIASLEEAARIAALNGVRIPGDWVKGADLDTESFIRLINTYIARLMAYTPRTPEERATEVDWERVRQLTVSGLTSDHTVDGGLGVRSTYKQYAQNNDCATCVTYYADYRLIGPADISGRYQEWLATPVAQRTPFEITTPDRRITGPEGPQSDGTYFRYRATSNLKPERGTYHFSRYQFYRFEGNYGVGAGEKLLAISAAEVDLLQAEALYRLGDLQGAAELVNRTRVANGGLPPVTPAGVVESDDCVPRRADGSCGDLWDALVYEKRIETAGGDQIAFFDARGFGLLTSGTFLHLPVPGRELGVYGMPEYSFGGGGEGSAP